MSAYEAGMKPRDLEDIYWRDLFLFIRGYTRRTRNEWEQTRLLHWSNYIMNTGDKIKKTPEKLLPFAWDKKPTRGQPISREELKNAIKMYSNGN